ncbi:sensor histidine kinase [Vibrio ostreicida]|uniref:sensor histidine kinase n=1 Tax=Vibrio ostreicida TaxID=526588 RepID=UPI003B5CCA82
MSSNHKIKQALSKTQQTLLLRLMSILLLCLLLAELAIGAVLFFDLYRTESKLMDSMATEYQRILTYDSAERLTHVMSANPYRLIDNNIAAYSVSSGDQHHSTFVAGDDTQPPLSNLSAYTTDKKFWFSAFITQPFMAKKMTGETQDFWLVLDNRARYPIAYKQWLMTFYALIVMLLVTAIFTRRIINNAMAPLVTLDDLLDQLSQGRLDNPPNPSNTDPKGLDVISRHVYDAISRLHHITVVLNTTVDAIAHDIRTPLSRITLASHSALLEQTDPTQLKHALADCAEYAARANTMLTTLMKLNDEQTGKREQKWVSTDLGHVINTVISWYEDVADEKSIELTFHLANHIVLQSDPDKLTQILVNLVDNAIKYTDAGGKVTIDAKLNHAHHLRIRVIDTGIGIEERDQHLVFERLFRVDSSRTNVEGYGLGLSLASAMAKNLGGEIHLTSQPHHGSTFTLLFTQP